MYYNNDHGGDSSIYLYDFNDVTGRVSNEKRLFDDPNDENYPYGLKFSRQSSKLYVSSFNGTMNYTYQYDLNSTNITATEILIQSQRGIVGHCKLVQMVKFMQLSL